jgi:ATP-dependent helicase/nuclease subunit B
MAGSEGKVYTIDPGEAFVDVLVRGLLNRYGSDPLALERLLLLLPTRRAVRAVGDAFLRANDGRPLILPTMRPIGDIDAEELAFDEHESDLALALPPAVSGLRRLLLLSQAVRRFDDDLSLAQSALLARELARLLDSLQGEDVALEAFDELVPDDYSAHWQKTLKFLQVLRRPWRNMLTAEGALDPIDRRNRLLRLQAARWREAPPDFPVIAAGSTGSIPATAELLTVICCLEQGAVILPGLDLAADQDVWHAIDPSHPQYGLKSLLQRLEVAREDISPFDPAQQFSPRFRLINEALRPAGTTDAWHRSAAVSEADLAGLRRIESPGAQEEATAIALALREVLETPGKTAALVTTDRGLARRVATEMQRWGVDIDDSAGQPLSATPPGAVLKLAAEVLAQEFAPVSLLALLKHPLVQTGRERATHLAAVRWLDRHALRGPKPAPGMGDVIVAAQTAGDPAPPAVNEMLNDLDRHVAPLLSTEPMDLQQLLAALCRFCEWLTTDDDGRCRLWDGDDGEAAMRFFADAVAASEGLGDDARPGFAALFGVLMDGQVVRPRYGRHPRLSIWGPLEARLQQADLLILGGMNEGRWPAEAEVDAWLSRPMRRDLGLPPPERRIGLAAHDFAQAAATPNVLLSRADKVDGTPTVPSRWLLRLERLLSVHDMALPDAADLALWRDGLDEPASVRPAAAPAPKPPVAARPTSLSVTQVETWVRDPYAIFARHILGLRPLEPLAADPDAALRGIAVHRALDRFVADYPTTLPPDALARLLAAGEEAFGPILQRPGVRAFWWPRFVRIAEWFLENEATHRGTAQVAASEVSGRLEITGGFVLTAKADRIDRLNDGSLAIIDYKTGQAPPTKDVASGYAPQLPLEAAIARAGGFEGIPAQQVSRLSYWRVSGGRKPAEIRNLNLDADETASDALQGLEKMVATFARRQMPYYARPRPAAAPTFSDYDHLARVKEWTAGGPGDT